MQTSPRAGALAFAACGLLTLLPLWVGFHFPSEDGPAHLYWVEVYRELGRPASPYEPYFVRNASWNLPNVTYLAVQYWLAAALEPHLAQKLALTLLLLLWIAAIRLLSQVAHGGLALGAFTALLFLHNRFLYGGYLGWLFGVVCLQFALAAAVAIHLSWHAGKPVNARLHVGLALLGVACYYSHYVSAALFLVVLATIALLWIRDLNRVIALMVSALPAAALVVSNLVTGTFVGGLEAMRWLPLGTRAFRLLTTGVWHGFAVDGWAFRTALLALVVVIGLSGLGALRALGGPRQRPAVLSLLLASVLGVLALAAPDDLGGSGDLNGRTLLALWCAFLPLAPVALSQRTQRAMGGIVVGLLLWQVSDYALRARRFDRDYRAALDQSLRGIPPGSLLRRSDRDGENYAGTFANVTTEVAQEIAHACRCVVLDGLHPRTRYYWVRERGPQTDTPVDFLIDVRHGTRPADPPVTFVITSGTRTRGGQGSASQ